jgi:hypothetical protein
MVYGIPFPDIYDWTWGEIAEYINCCEEKQKDDLRIEASMLFRTASMLSRMVMGTKGTTFTVMDEYDFLWSKEEKQKAKADKRHASLMRKSKPKKAMTLDEQDRMLSELKQKMLKERQNQ